MDDEENTPKDNLLETIQQLSDWSKWLMSLDVVAATGCVLVLKGDTAEAVRPMLLLAIILFSLSTLCSSLFVFLLSSQIEKIAEVREIKFKRFGIAQLVLFAAGLLCLLAWVAMLSRVFS
ncbi:MAG TPA: hypothetical protein VIS96_01545 [Terrimicrobiaceae bacterium]